MSRALVVAVNLTVPEGFSDADAEQLVREAVTAEVDRAMAAHVAGQIVVHPCYTLAHVAGAERNHLGGNVEADVFMLQDDTVVSIGADNIIHYPTHGLMDDETEDPWAFPRIDRCFPVATDEERSNGPKGGR